MGKMNITEVEEVSYGLYLWETPEGKLVVDEDGNYLNVPAIKGDIIRINRLKKAAKNMGLDGQPVWFSGHRQVTEDEYEYQKQRMDLGLIPDELDVPAIKEDIEQKRKMGLYK
jgi:hypothetical protein